MSLFSSASKIASKAGQIAPYIRTVADLLGVYGLDKSAPIFGGLTQSEAVQLMSEFSANRPASKNLYVIGIATPIMAANELGIEEGAFTISKAFSIFASDVTYTPVAISGEKRRVGGTVADSPNGIEQNDITITTYDDERGILKRWYQALARRVANEDGTVGVPADYETVLTIVHGVGGPNYPGFKDAFRSTYRVRPSTGSVELSRGDRSAEQISMQFTPMNSWEPAKAVI